MASKIYSKPSRIHAFVKRRLFFAPGFER